MQEPAPPDSNFKSNYPRLGDKVLATFPEPHNSDCQSVRILWLLTLAPLFALIIVQIRGSGDEVLFNVLTASPVVPGLTLVNDRRKSLFLRSHASYACTLLGLFFTLRLATIYAMDDVYNSIYVLVLYWLFTLFTVGRGILISIFVRSDRKIANGPVGEIGRLIFRLPVYDPSLEQINKNYLP